MESSNPKDPIAPESLTISSVLYQIPSFFRFSGMKRGKFENLWFADNEIPTDIFSRLDTKTLLKVKCVSNEWNRFLSSHSFVHCYHLKNKKPELGFLFQEKYQWSDEDIESVSYISAVENSVVKSDTLFGFLPRSVVVSSSSGGLIFCRTCLSSSLPAEIYICNPANKNFVTVNLPSLDIGKSLALAFDPVKDTVDSATSFQLVRVCQKVVDEETTIFSFDIYSSETFAWKRSKEVCICEHNLYKNKGIYVSGFLYWMTTGDQILMFDLKTELSWLVNTPVPSSEFTSIPDMCIGESNGQLHYVVVCELGFQLWVLDDHFASKWNLKLGIDLDEWETENEALYQIKEKVSRRKALDAMPWVNTLAYKDGLLLLRISSFLYLYNFEARKLTRVCNISNLGPHSMYGPIVVPYTMSLVAL